MDKKFKEGDYVICRESHLGEPVWVPNMDGAVGKKLVVEKVSSTSGRLGCRSENADWYWYEPYWLEPYPKKRRAPKVFKVGDIVICRKKGKVTNAVDWHLLMDRTIGKPMVVVEMSTNGYPRCRVDGEENTWTYLPEWLEYYKGFKVGDIVICKEKHGMTDSVKWVRSMDATIGKPMTVVGMSESGNLHCKIDGCDTWAYAPEWLEPYTEKGNEEMKRDGNNVAPVMVDENVYYGIKEIISNPVKRATTVIFNDGKIVCVKAGVDVEKPDIYSAVTAAIGIRFAGSNNALKNIISRKTTELKPKRKGTRKEFTIEAGDLVKLTRKAQKDAVYPARTTDGEPHPLLSVRIEKDADREMLVTDVVKEDGKTIAYVNVPEQLKDFEYKVPVEFLRITRKGK